MHRTLIQAQCKPLTFQAFFWFNLSNGKEFTVKVDFKRFAKTFTFDLETSKVTAQPLLKSSVYLNYESGRAKGREYMYELWMKIF